MLEPTPTIVLEHPSFADWLNALRDKRAAARIDTRIRRLEQGNLGDWKPIRDGVIELRVEEGPGYRIYLARLEQHVVLLVAGGDKSTQKRDIEVAVQRLSDVKAGYSWN